MSLQSQPSPEVPTIQKKESKLVQTLRLCSKQKALLVMTVPFIIWVLIFRYLPVWGWTMAFQDYRPARSFTEQEWVGLDHFMFLFQDNAFLIVLRNTFAMSFINMVLGFVTAIGLAVLLNEIRNVGFRRIVQTISYMPHFLSWVVAASIVSYTLSLENGIVNILLTNLRIIDEPILWLGVGEYFWGIIGAAETWKNVGWNTIIYLAAIAMIDQSQYEAAEIDGASRIQRIMHITIPAMKPVIIILVIMNLGYILESGFEPQYLLGNPMNYHYSENIDIFVLKYGISMGNFSLATAAGIFKTVVAFVFLFAANGLAKKFGQARLF
ncbi:binding-protein-dependent transport systems inner membrane component [Halalkalibacter hemicellulosilyticusJCM 9152]|uniref:Binding-protein-dependent transport systems inner membrane component n=2 Tax=Bacillaceae TaxID=186817 RepID=W4QG17_9BACI|nr:binding-protein-dependent transport systems inner membrane component [Halalkalibacter hemicellulosilyticusJCM 9152]